VAPIAGLMPRRPAMGATLTAPAVDRPGALRRRMHPPVVAGGAGAARPAQRRRRVLKAWRIALWALLTSLGPAAGAQQAAAPGALVEAGPEGPRTGPGWRLAALPRQDIAATRYSAERTPDAAAPGGQLLALRIDADRSYGNWVHELPGLDLPARLRWRWRVRQACNWKGGSCPSCAAGQKASRDARAWATRCAHGPGSRAPGSSRCWRIWSTSRTRRPSRSPQRC